MYYSLTFGGERNTWTDWQLIPSTPPTVAPPEPVKNQVEIPGRRLGPIDLSDFPFNRMTYKRITGTWDFLRETARSTTRRELFEQLRKYLHGKTTTVRMEEDPAHYFRGRFTVGTASNGRGPTSISIGYDLEPMRYNLDGTVDETWVYETDPQA